MSDTIQATIELKGDGWTITGSILPDPSNILPPEIFIYENTGEVTLGKYVGVCNLNELRRLKIWSGTAIPKAGNKYVRYGEAKILLSLDADANYSVQNMINTAKVLKTEMQAASSKTEVFVI